VDIAAEIPSVVSDLIAGLVGSGIVGFAAVVVRRVGFGTARLHLAAPVPVQPVVRFIQAYPWRILVAIFLVASVVLFFTSPEQYVAEPVAWHSARGGLPRGTGQVEA
jgi:hypothetical protein